LRQDWPYYGRQLSRGAVPAIIKLRQMMTYRQIINHNFQVLSNIK
jgi:hypothetical protein